MDALYGRTFNLENLNEEVLAVIDDLFGPLSFETLAQVIHFARGDVITDDEGKNRYALRQNLKSRWTFPTLAIHGAENGLVDVATLWRNQELFKDAGIDLAICPIDGRGHQDCL